MKMKAVREYNEVETFYHAVSPFCYEQLMAQAGGNVENIKLFGRVFNGEISRETIEQDFEEVQGKGFVFAMDYRNREDATPGTSGFAGIVLILGWNGQNYDESIDLSGEYLVPLSAYKVIGVME